MYPTAIIVLIETQRSTADICEISTSNSNRLTGSLSFAIGTVHITTSNEAESQLSQRRGGPEHVLEEVTHEVKEIQVDTSSCIAIPGGSNVTSK